MTFAAGYAAAIRDAAKIVELFGHPFTRAAIATKIRSSVPALGKPAYVKQFTKDYDQPAVASLLPAKCPTCGSPEASRRFWQDRAGGRVWLAYHPVGAQLCPDPLHSAPPEAKGAYVPKVGDVVTYVGAAPETTAFGVRIVTVVDGEFAVCADLSHDWKSSWRYSALRYLRDSTEAERVAAGLPAPAAVEPRAETSHAASPRAEIRDGDEVRRAVLKLCAAARILMMAHDDEHERNDLVDLVFDAENLVAKGAAPMTTRLALEAARAYRRHTRQEDDTEENLAALLDAFAARGDDDGERCAKVCDGLATQIVGDEAIDKRSPGGATATTWYAWQAQGATRCAAAIRALPPAPPPDAAARFQEAAIEESRCEAEYERVSDLRDKKQADEMVLVHATEAYDAATNARRAAYSALVSSRGAAPK